MARISPLGWRARRRPVPFVPQMERSDCSAACLAMVLQTHGHYAPLAELRVACGVSRDGASALGILHGARSLGLEASARRVEEAEALRKLPLPAVLHWDFDHFVVLERFRGDTAVIVDPKSGRLVIGMDALGKRFTGVVLVLQPGPGFRRRPARRPDLARYRELVGRFGGGIVQVLLASCALQLIGLVVPVATQLVVDRAVLPGQEPWLWGIALAAALAAVARLLVALARAWVLQGLQSAMDAALMTRFVDHMLRLPHGFYLQREAGELVRRVQGNAVIRSLFGSQAAASLLDAVSLLGYAALMLAYNLQLGLVVLAFAAVRCGLFAWMSGANRRYMASELAAAEKEEAALISAFSALETTRAAGSEARQVERWQRHMTTATNQRLARYRLELNAAHAVTVLKAVMTGLVFVVGGRAVLDQQLTLGEFAGFLALQAIFLLPLDSFLKAATDLQYVGTHMRRLDDVLETPRERVGGIDPGVLRGSIELRNVTFRHHPASPLVLDNVSLSVRPGEKVAIVGPSGSGKSTLLRLLLGQHVPSEGQVLFDGRDLATLDLGVVRRQIGAVPQEVFIFNDTVHGNLALGDCGATMDRLAEAVHLACLDEVIEQLPAGYATRLGENGAVLSGGQRQRLSLARALVRPPAMLLLDEATSSLDLETERQVHQRLSALSCTRIVITHRIASIADADRIVVMDAGKVVQVGSYRQLVAVEGLFRTLVAGVELRHDAECVHEPA